jgi:hypothetical protein
MEGYFDELVMAGTEDNRDFKAIVNNLPQVCTISYCRRLPNVLMICLVNSPGVHDIDSRRSTEFLLQKVVLLHGTDPRRVIGRQQVARVYPHRRYPLDWRSLAGVNRDGDTLRRLSTVRSPRCNIADEMVVTGRVQS